MTAPRALPRGGHRQRPRPVRKQPDPASCGIIGRRRPARALRERRAQALTAPPNAAELLKLVDRVIRFTQAGTDGTPVTVEARSGPDPCLPRRTVCPANGCLPEWPGQRDAQLFWLALLGAVRAANGGAESPPAAPGFNGQAMVDKVLAEVAASGGPFVLIIDDLHELSSRVQRRTPWAGVKAPPRHPPPSAAAPIIAKYTGVLAAARTSRCSPPPPRSRCNRSP